MAEGLGIGIGVIFTYLMFLAIAFVYNLCEVGGDSMVKTISVCKIAKESVKEVHEAVYRPVRNFCAAMRKISFKRKKRGCK